VSFKQIEYDEDVSLFNVVRKIMEQIKIVATITQGDNGLFCLTLVHFKEEQEV